MISQRILLHPEGPGHGQWTVEHMTKYVHMLKSQLGFLVPQSLVKCTFTLREITICLAFPHGSVNHAVKTVLATKAQK